MFRALPTIIKRINEKFYVKAKGEEKKVAWIKWKDYCKQKEFGGLGIKNIDNFNMAWEMDVESVDKKPICRLKYWKQNMVEVKNG